MEGYSAKDLVDGVQSQVYEVMGYRFTDILDYNAPLYNSRILPTLQLKLTGVKDLHHCIQEKENQVNLT